MTSGSQGKTRIDPSIPSFAETANAGDRLQKRSVKEPLLVVDRAGRELARPRVGSDQTAAGGEPGVAASKIAMASNTGRRASILPSGPRLKMPTQTRSSPLDGARRPRSSR